MKIISNFSDYYDGCQYMCGEDTVFPRYLNNGSWKNSKHSSDLLWEFDEEILKKSSEIFKKELKNYGYVKNSYIASENILFIGEKIIPFIVYEKREYGENSDRIFYFELEEALKNNINFARKNIKNFFNKDFTSLYNKIREIHNDVIVLYSSFSSYEGSFNEKIRRGTNLNPKLKDLGLSKFLEPHEVIQEIEMFLNKEKVKNTTFTDKEKLHQAGFDKNSFKKTKD